LTIYTIEGISFETLLAGLTKLPNDQLFFAQCPLYFISGQRK
jgi:hypothetical protein